MSYSAVDTFWGGEGGTYTRTQLLYMENAGLFSKMMIHIPVSMVGDFRHATSLWTVGAVRPFSLSHCRFPLCWCAEVLHGFRGFPPAVWAWACYPMCRAAWIPFGNTLLKPVNQCSSGIWVLWFILVIIFPFLASAFTDSLPAGWMRLLVLLLYFSVCVCVCVCVHAHIPQHSTGGQRITLCSQFLLPFLFLRSPRFPGKHFYYIFNIHCGLSV